MRLATVDFVAMTQGLCNNLHALGAYTSTVSGNIDKIIRQFDKNYSQIIPLGATATNPIGMLFAAYQVVPCFNFKTYINRMHKDSLDRKHSMMTHKSLMGMAKSKFNYLCNKGTWDAKSLEDNKIVAMTATIKRSKAWLKLSPQLAFGRSKGKKTKNKKNMLDRVKQKKDKAWTKILPKVGNKRKIEHNIRTYYWCKYHMAWTMHTSNNCPLGNEQKGEKKSSAAVAAAATTGVNPSYQTLLSSLTRFHKNEE